MANTGRAGLLLILTLLPTVSPGSGHPPPARTEVAPGVFLFRTEPYGDVGLDGNSIAILSREGVVVFDANGTPAAAEAVVAQIRELTDAPVRFLVLSHWHWDHWYGAEVYRQAFPGVQIVSHEAGRRMMTGPALAFNAPGLDSELPGYLASLEQEVATAQRASPPPPELPALRTLLEADRFFLAQKKSVRHTFADVTFTDQLSIHLGEREIQVLHYGRAVTPGDALLYLPREKVLLAGDLLVNPVSFALSCYPTEWLKALERIDALDASIIVPGHGAPLHDEDLLHATRDVLRELLQQGKQAKARGLDADQARAEIAPRLQALKTRVTRDEPGAGQAFDVYLVDWCLHRVYEELDGPLSDEIAPIPAR